MSLLLREQNDVMVGLPPGFFANNPGVAAQVESATGSFARSFNQNTGFGKVTGVLNGKNSINVTYNYQRFRSPHGYFNTPTSTGDGLSLASLPRSENTASSPVRKGV